VTRKDEKNTRQILLYESEHWNKEVTPMLKSVPEWYKKIPRSVLVPEESPEPMPSAKACVPFLDGLTFGYSINLWTDLLVERDKDGEPILRYKVGKIGARPSLVTDPMPTPTGYEDHHFTWVPGAAIKLPEGYSALYTHPLNRFELPFLTVGAIVDGDVGIPGGNVPFYLKKGFEGLIPQGTPIIQVIPFLREDWISKEVKGMVPQCRQREHEGPHDWYRKFGWKRKSFK